MKRLYARLPDDWMERRHCGAAGNTALGLYHSASSNGPWTRIGTCDSAVNGQYAFPFAANALLSGFYRVDMTRGTLLIIK